MEKCFGKIKNFGLFLFLIFAFVCSNYAQEPDWMSKLRKLKLLESTKADVEREFDFPKVTNTSDDAEKEKNGAEYITYETKDGILDVKYSIGTCSELNSSFGYDVSAGTITKLSFEPKKTVKASLLNFNYDKFEGQSVSDVPGLTSYRNLEDGVDLNIFKGKVIKIQFSPSAKYDYLECK